jgi:hypothetical protein
VLRGPGRRRPAASLDVETSIDPVVDAGPWDRGRAGPAAGGYSPWRRMAIAVANAQSASAAVAATPKNRPGPG